MAGIYDFSVEKKVTETYKAFREAHPALRELKCLRQMYPAVFLPIEEADVFAGRIRMPMIGVSPEPGGLGYYCDKPGMRERMEGLCGEQLTEAQSLLEYWAEENTNFKVRAAYPAHIAQALPSDAWEQEPLAAAPLYRMAGTYLDYDKLLRLGIPGLKEDIAARAQKGGDAALFEAMLGALDLLADCCLHYRQQALRLHKPALADALLAITRRAPATLREAMQLMWLYALISGTINYGRLDDVFGDFLAKDLENGTLNEDEAQLLWNGLWQLMADRHTTWNGRVILGGRNRRNIPHADRAALFALEATRQVKEIEPQLSLRVYAGMDPRLVEKALQCIREGRTYPILYNDDVNVPAVARAFDIPENEAQDYVPFGCGEYILNHRSVGSPNGIINLLKVLELTLRNGRDGLTGRQLGPQTGEFADFETFEQLWDAYAKQIEYYVSALAEQEAIEYRIAGETAPFLYVSMLYDDCIARGKGIFDGGVPYLGGTVETYGNINTADSLTAIKTLVYEQRKVKPEELLAALDADFENQEPLRQLLKRAPKYGNDDEAADAMACRVHEHICRAVRDQARGVGLDSYLVVIINNSANTTLGKQTAASPDGRHSRQYMANANNPFGGNDQKGLTAMLNSLVKLRPDLHAGAVQNMKFSPELFQGSCVARSVLQTYFGQGGTQAMISVVRRGDLEAAMAHPEDYSHLFVRVGGFSARFVTLEKAVQQEILSRTLY